MAEPLVPMDPFRAVNSPLSPSSEGFVPFLLAARHGQPDGIHAEETNPDTQMIDSKRRDTIEDTTQQNAMRRALRSHMSGLIRSMPALGCAAVLLDSSDCILDVVGQPALVATLNRLSQNVERFVMRHKRQRAIQEIAAASTLSPGSWTGEPKALPKATGEDLSDAAKGLCSQVDDEALGHMSVGYATISDRNGHAIGSLAMFHLTPNQDELVCAFAVSAALAISNTIALEYSRQDSECVLHSLLSHLDYHVIRVLMNGAVETNHPVPLPESIRKAMTQYAATKEDGDADVFFEDRLYHCNLRTLTDSSGCRMGRLAIFRDITQEKQMESHMRDADKLTVLASLAAGIAHEIRNPLTTAKGFLQLFAERQCENPDRRYLDLTIHELNRISELVKDFMSLARPEHRLYQPVDLVTLAGEVQQFLQPEAILHGITLDFETSDPELCVYADANQLKQVLINVVQNAMQACDEGNRVWLAITAKKNTVALSVHDTGPGLTQEQLSKVFQPFFTTKATGTGLGLPISKQIMKEHGGSIEIKSEVGKGTTVFLDFPRISSSCS